ncbi:MAG: aldo/keto reductase [Kiritimatiellaceae bacterium]|nr:aldo/keto reductase [Kiritimatiellaceae bacterium]
MNVVRGIMNRVAIPHTDLLAAPLALGTANLGVNVSEEEGKRILDRFVGQGGNLIDTARVYSDWIPGEKNRSERILGDWLAERKARDRVLISTKGGHPFLPPCADTVPRLAPAQLDEDISGSLKSLRAETIDLYWLHRDDPALPVGPIMDSLHRFQKSGRIRFYAASNWTPERMEEANAYAYGCGYDGFVASQVEWNPGVFHRLPGGDPTMLNFSAGFLRLHRETGLAAIPYASQAGGYFSKRSRDAGSVSGSPYDTPENRALHAVLAEIAEELRFSMTQVVLAYLWSHPFPVIPIVGCRTLEQLNDSLSAAGCRLPEEAMFKINRLINLNG